MERTGTAAGKDKVDRREPQKEWKPQKSRSHSFSSRPYSSSYHDISSTSFTGLHHDRLLHWTIEHGHIINLTFRPMGMMTLGHLQEPKE